MALGPMLTNLLKRAGLEGLTKWASDMVITGASEAEIEISLYDQRAFRDRFPMIFQRSNNGYGPISVSEVLAYENQAMEMAKSVGTSVSREEISEMIANDVSMQEAQERLGMAGEAVHMVSTTYRAELKRLYGIDDGDLTRYWLDPKKEAPVLKRRFMAAGVAQQATRSGWGQLTSGQAEGLVKLGMDEESAGKGFSALVQSEELFQAVDPTEGDIDAESQLQVITGNQELVAEVEKRGEKRAAKFKEGGGFSTGSSGVAGLGSANK